MANGEAIYGLLYYRSYTTLARSCLLFDLRTGGRRFRDLFVGAEHAKFLVDLSTGHRFSGARRWDRLVSALWRPA